MVGNHTSVDYVSLEIWYVLISHKLGPENNKKSHELRFRIHVFIVVDHLSFHFKINRCGNWWAFSTLSKSLGFHIVFSNFKLLAQVSINSRGPLLYMYMYIYFKLFIQVRGEEEENIHIIRLSLIYNYFLY